MTDDRAAIADRWAAYSDSLKLDQQQFDALVEQRTKDDNTPVDRNRRSWRRLPVSARLWVPVEILGPSGSINQVRAYPIDISAGGMCMLVGMFVHAGSTFTLTLQLADGELVHAKGKAARCTFIKGRAHEVAIEFTEKFDMALLMPSGASTAVGQGVEGEQSTPPGQNGLAPDVQHGPAEQSGAAAPHGGNGGSNTDRAALVEIKQMTDVLVLAVENFASRVNALTSPR